MKSDRPSYDYWYLAVLGFLVIFGLTVLASATGPSGFQKMHDSYWFVKHQMLIGLAPGILGFIFFWKVPYTLWKKNYLLWYLLCVALLLAVFIPGLGNTYGTATSWINLYGYSFQTSELVKLFGLIALAGWLDAAGRSGVKEFKRGLVPFALGVALLLGLLALQPDIGSMSVIAAEFLIVYFAAGGALSFISLLTFLGILAITVLIKIKPYRADRFMIFLHPELDPQGAGYHINQALLTIGSGGILGLGFGNSRQKYQYLPEVEGDSVFAIIAEELGLIMCLVLIAAFLFLLYRSLKIAERAPDVFGKCVATGVAGWIVVQAFVNIGSMIGLMPMTGLTLPFVSYGGSSLVVLLSACGLVFQISEATKNNN
ncbi:MAG: FtsW/RodA/SpoVE family cell cycle protein [bacterium]